MDGPSDCTARSGSSVGKRRRDDDADSQPEWQSETTAKKARQARIDYDEDTYGISAHQGSIPLQPALDPKDYSVGWISALPLETAAAKGMLDQIHDSTVQLPNDINTYTLGSMARHNIAIATLPDYGVVNAAIAAANMHRSFPSICLWLVVGVGGGRGAGGVDARLGDVVISNKLHQTDFGKVLQDGHFDNTGLARTPSPALMSAVRVLEAKHEMVQSAVSVFTQQMLQRYSRMTAYSDPGAQFDLLFESTYEHVGPANDICGDCDKSRLVARPERADRHPRFHYGPVASANQIVRHAGTRDGIVSEFDVMCFEMEGAGLMSSYSCLVIRGISDYSDSHKNKRYQRYAAANAAAYAKELLSVMAVRRDPASTGGPNLNMAENGSKDNPGKMKNAGKKTKSANSTNKSSSKKPKSKKKSRKDDHGENQRRHESPSRVLSIKDVSTGNNGRQLVFSNKNMPMSVDGMISGDNSLQVLGLDPNSSSFSFLKDFAAAPPTYQEEDESDDTDVTTELDQVEESDWVEVSAPAVEEVYASSSRCRSAAI